MITTQVKALTASESTYLEKHLNTFLLTIDARQIIKTEYSTCGWSGNGVMHSVVIYYIDIKDVRNSIIENILDK